ncbi:ligase-associated DNA damage response endonuclease PdeM [Pedobacter faecalis]|uniref:ligase-associated DNA damage response endonuclease PdeM n=1 Tax=Pedobacter faecalis TaxID=3041495 RepID=UPI00254AAEDC|nr:ligase-associated DNA damage response endonuclease PdeM [Pedobacter sp. ELA7]
MQEGKMTIDCNGEQLILSKERAIFWPRERMLIISDLHVGKSAHFRKSGVPVPDLVGTSDLKRLASLIREFEPATLLVTGDMFHNHLNSDVEVFREWRSKYPELKVVLIKGNHDRLSDSEYEGLDIEIYHKELLLAPFRFIHDKPTVSDAYFNISGHIHPGVVLHGRARQRLRFPCFYFSSHCAVLPAFSVFTGLFLIKPETGDRFYAITAKDVVAV